MGTPDQPRQPRLSDLVERVRAGVEELAKALPDRQAPEADTPPREGMQGRLDRQVDSLSRLNRARREGTAPRAALRAIIQAFPEADDAVAGLINRRFGHDPARRLAAQTAHKTVRERLTRPTSATQEADVGTALAAIGLALRDLRGRLERIEAQTDATADDVAALRAAVDALSTRGPAVDPPHGSREGAPPSEV